MSAKKVTAVKVETLRRQLAGLEARADVLRARIARTEAKATGAPPPITGLDLLWKAAYPIARTRSSKVQCRAAWNRIPIAERPPVAEVVTALKVWNRCAEWKKDGNQFVPALHRFIQNRMWEDLPAVPDPMARYRAASTPPPVHTTPTIPATQDEISQIFAPVKRMRS